jgi:hypothetical protein
MSKLALVGLSSHWCSGSDLHFTDLYRQVVINTGWIVAGAKTCRSSVHIAQNDRQSVLAAADDHDLGIRSLYIKMPSLDANVAARHRKRLCEYLRDIGSITIPWLSRC